MQLESLHIRRETYGENRGKLQGDIVYQSPSGKIQVLLSDELSTKLLYIVAENMVETTQQLANQLTAEVITQIPALAAP